MPAIATGQISILDFNDAPSLTAFVTTTAQKTQVFDPPTGVYTPSWNSSTGPVLQPSLFVSTTGSVDQIANATSVTWYDSANMTTALTTAGAYSITGNTLKIVSNIMTGSVYSKTFIAEIVWTDVQTGANHLIRAEFTFSRINNGATGATGAYAVSAVLSNNSHNVATDSAGGGGVYTNATTTMSIYEGATDASATWTVTAAAASGVTGSLSGKTYTVTNMTVDSGYVDLTAAKSGQPSITQRFSLAKNKAGVNAPVPVSYDIDTSTLVLAKNISNVYAPTTVTFTGKSITGAGLPVDYAGKWTIEESADGITYTAAKYTSAANEASKVYTPSAATGIKTIRAKLFAAGTTVYTGTPLDYQVVQVVTDGATGATGADAVFVSTWHPTGNLFKNDAVTSLSVTADVYKGGAVVVATSYEWFAQKSGQADQGAGTGWEKLTTANQASYGVTGAVNATTLTVTAEGVVNLAVFKIKATYATKTYFDSAIFYDSTDPIMVEVTSSKGNMFKNGAVDSELVCKLSQNGAEIDPKLASATVGYKYTYTWSKYKLDGTQDMTFGGTGTKVGKFISITDADIDQKAVFKVDIT